MSKLLYRSMIVFALMAVVFAAGISPVSADAPAPDKQTARFEISFMENMIDHHAMAVMMAEMCLMKAVHPELIATCKSMMMMQSQEIEMMQMWLHHWYGITYEPDMHMGEMEGHMMMDSNEFEKWFMKHMINHHATAVREAEDCLEDAYHAELISMCQDIIATQSQEIDMMQMWLCDWYGMCVYRPNL
jgi:uncharacterized protein (DUF305 family)